MTSIGIITLVYSGLMVVIGIALLLRPRQIAKVVMEIAEEPEGTFGFGILATILGLVILGIGSRVVWTGTLWVVPLLGWLTFIKGVLLVLVPDIAKPFYKPFLKSTSLLMVFGLVALAIGIWLFYIK
ncbi:MAG: hypothetical protein V1826_00545 [bacterium]